MGDSKISEKVTMSGGKEIPITELNAGQLQRLSQQLEQEIEFIQGSLSQLKMAQGKFSESNEKDILVPLTSSMYTTGKIGDVGSVIVDIGTGYYVERTVDQAREYFSRKVDYLTKQMEKVQPILAEKYKMRQAVMEMLQMKVQQQIQQQQQQMASTAAQSQL